MRERLCLLSFVFCPLLVALVGCSKGPMGKGGEPKFRFAPITRADVVRTVEATGRVTPRNTSSGIPVGAQVNGKVIKLFVDYNSVVTNGQVVALIDPLVYEATYKSAVAQLHSNQAKLVLAEKTLVRKQNLFKKQMCSEADLDQAIETRDTTKAAVEQSEAAVSKAKADLGYCTIRSPVNGVVIARKVEEGETVVSSYNAVPVLTIAEDLNVIWVEATVPEADVGNIKIGQEVTFTADAYRKRFKGKVKQVRKAATTTNNVVTYPIIIEAENPDQMLFPDMTATLSIETARAENAVVVSAAAFRFRPKEDEREAGEVPRGRKIWLVGESGKLKPVVITEGVSDTSFTQLVGADALEGKEAVVGYETPATLAMKN
ncbi:MAG: efflux RND transporter periplasmic adaptor subunit, partial [bacterium]|nr:efflux RND transporter periplasmic adaptor subunit [Candidatus Colisoma equi]